MAKPRGKFSQLLAPGLMATIQNYFPHVWSSPTLTMAQGRCQTCLKVSTAGQTVNGQWFCNNHMPSTLQCPSCGIFSPGSKGTSFCPSCIKGSIRVPSGGITSSNYMGTAYPGAIHPNNYYDWNLDLEQLDKDFHTYSNVKPNDSKTAMISKKLVTPTQAFNEMHMLLSALIKQYGKKRTKFTDGHMTEEVYEIELEGGTIEDANFVAEKQRLSCTKDTETLNYKVILNFEKDKLP